jgi:Raf kinase inhibitor-like YbhB/YbcL family protein
MRNIRQSHCPKTSSHHLCLFAYSDLPIVPARQKFKLKLENPMQLVSTDFRQGEVIPLRNTCEGDNISPEFSWKQAPENTKSFALVIHDPDAPKPSGFTHWVVYDIPAGNGNIKGNMLGEKFVPGNGVQGKNDKGEIGYTGPCPPSGTHRYFVYLYALDRQLDLPSGATREQLNQAMEGHILEQAELMGKYAKQKEKAA